MEPPLATLDVEFSCVRGWGATALATLGTILGSSMRGSRLPPRNSGNSPHSLSGSRIALPASPISPHSHENAQHVIKYSHLSHSAQRRGTQARDRTRHTRYPLAPCWSAKSPLSRKHRGNTPNAATDSRHTRHCGREAPAALLTQSLPADRGEACGAALTTPPQPTPKRLTLLSTF